jgi:hypothetical protein
MGHQPDEAMAILEQKNVSIVVSETQVGGGHDALPQDAEALQAPCRDPDVVQDRRCWWG